MFFVDAVLNKAVELIWSSSKEQKNETPLEICANDLAQEIFRVLHYTLSTHIKSKFGEIGSIVSLSDVSNHKVTLYIAIRYAKSWDIHQRNFASLSRQNLNEDDRAYVTKTLANIQTIYELANIRRNYVAELNTLNNSSYYLTPAQAEAIKKKQEDIDNIAKTYRAFYDVWYKELESKKPLSSTVKKADAAFSLAWPNLWVFTECSQKGPEFEGYIPHALVQSQLRPGGRIEADVATKAVVPVEVVIEEKVNSKVTSLAIEIGELIEKSDKALFGYSLSSSAEKEPTKIPTSKRDFINKAVKEALARVAYDKGVDEKLNLLIDVAPAP